MHRSIPVVFLFAACAAGPRDRDRASDAPAPLTGVADAYAAAAAVSLASVAPLELPGLHNVFRLSPTIVSGSEPHGEVAFAELRKLGVKTILSVDGAVPDAALAARYGMRYVHVPIQYKGIDPDEALRIAKTFRELDGPFYVHCFHGKHRGPAAAALGRCLVDGASRQQAIAEMRQWMGTAPEYHGLYQTIATQDLPTAAATAAYRFDFPAEHRAEGFVAAMVELARAFDHLKDAAARDFAADPDHPDIDARNEARKARSLLAQCQESKEYTAAKPDFRAWMDDAARTGEALVLALEQARPSGPREIEPDPKQLVAALGKSCKACHKVYRDD